MFATARRAARRPIERPDVRGSWPDEGGVEHLVVGTLRSDTEPATSSGGRVPMSKAIAGVEVPETAATAEASRLIRETTGPLLYHHSRRVFFFGRIHAHRLGVTPDPELLYLAAMFHDTGLVTPFSDVEQRFEVDGADHGRRFLLEHGFSTAAADTVWTAIALHTTPGIPDRMGPEIATTYLGVLTDVLGFGLDELPSAHVEEILAIHPRGDFKNDFLRAYLEGLKNRPETTNGTVNSDVLEHFLPGFRRTTTVERILGSAWPS
jgi:hypothetical protein